MPKITKYFSDIIACVKFEDLYCFFSFVELYENKSLTDTKFINTNNFSKETLRILSDNEFIGIGDMFTHTTIEMKKSLYDFFQLGYLEPDVNEKIFNSSSRYRRTSTGIFRYLNGKDTSLGKTNFLSDKNFSSISFKEIS